MHRNTQDLKFKGMCGVAYKREQFLKKKNSVILTQTKLFKLIPTFQHNSNGGITLMRNICSLPNAWETKLNQRRGSSATIRSTEPMSVTELTLNSQHSSHYYIVVISMSQLVLPRRLSWMHCKDGEEQLVWQGWIIYISFWCWFRIWFGNQI